MGKECCGGHSHPSIQCGSLPDAPLKYGKKLAHGNYAYEVDTKRAAEVKKIRASVSNSRLKDQERFLEEELHNTRAQLGKKNVDWAAKYLELQRETAQEAARWGRRYEELEEAYKEQLERVKEEFDEAMNEGYEEAYQMLLHEKQMNEQYVAQLEAELTQAKQNLADAEKTAEQGYAQAYEIIQDMRNRMSSAELSGLTAEANVLLRQMQEAEDKVTEENKDRELYGDDFTKGDGEVGGK